MRTARTTLDGLHVLVVDDEAEARDFLTFALERYGADVTAVGSAAEAMDEIEQWIPSVLVSDIGMSGENGYDLIRKIRKLAAERGKHIPAVAVTAFSRVEDRAQALSAGYQMHMPKPVDPAALAMAVADLAGRDART